MTVPVSRSNPDHSERQRRLDSALAEYLRAAEAGQAPDRREFLARHPDLEADLVSFFADEDRVKEWARPLLGPDEIAPGASIGRSDWEAEFRAGSEFGDFEL